MHITGTAVINLLPDGSFVPDGDYGPAVSEGLGAPFEAIGLASRRTGVGEYRVSAPGAAWPDGWKITIFRDENDENTVRVVLSTDGDELRLQTLDPDSRERADIIYMMTVRVAVSGDIAYDPPPAPEVTEPAMDDDPQMG